jgi:hypothetical protein
VAPALLDTAHRIGLGPLDSGSFPFPKGEPVDIDTPQSAEIVLASLARSHRRPNLDEILCLGAVLDRIETGELKPDEYAPSLPYRIADALGAVPVADRMDK